MKASVRILQDKFKGKIVGVIAPGKSLEELERRIEEFRDLPIVWVGMNLFDCVEPILKKINKSFTMVGDTATVGIEREAWYETNIRLPRVVSFLERENVVYMTSNIVRDFCFLKTGNKALYEKYANKISIIEEVFNLSSLPIHIKDELRKPPPNSISLAFAAVIAGGAKKLITFGYDGYPHRPTNTSEGILNSYYKPEENNIERQHAFGKVTPGNLVGDTKTFNERWNTLFRLYKEVFDNKSIDMVNCSPNSVYTKIRKISYDELKKEF